MDQFHATYRDVTTSGVRTRVLDVGRHNAEALILIHGFLSSHNEFRTLIPRLSTFYRLLIPDLPGFGESEKPSPHRYRYTVNNFCESIVDLIAAFQVGRVHIVGHSMGGAVALTLGAQHPELVQKLILIDTLAYPCRTNLVSRAAFTPVLGGLIFKQFYGKAVFGSYFKNYASGCSDETLRDLIDSHYILFNNPLSRESAYATLRSMVDLRSVVARINRVQCPTLVVWGQHDSILPVTHAQRLSREIPLCRLEIMNSGHSPHIEMPDAFCSLLLGFLRGRKA